MAATEYFINLNYVCNERCIFCAADLAKGFPIDSRRLSLTLEAVQKWVGDGPPGPRDRVMLAGGEPTLHRELLPIVRFLSANCREVFLFTNGLRLGDLAFARATVEAGVTHFEIALFGASATRHDAITRVPGSFERTLATLNTLASLRREFEFTITVRLLVSRQSSLENPGIVRLVRERAPGIDAISLNRLILSESARDADATISWEEARSSINESARLVRKFGYELVFGALPLCLFEGDNAAFVRDRVARRAERIAAGLEPGEWQIRYLDPVLAAGHALEGTSIAPLALPDPCLPCDYLPVCGRVEAWYVRRYGVAGLRTVDPDGRRAGDRSG